MRKLISTAVVMLMWIGAVKSQDNINKNPTIQDLDFLIGVWEVQFDWYDTHKPGSEPVFYEKGTMVCNYDLDYKGTKDNKGTKKFIFCKSSLDTYEGRLKGRHRETLAVIQWSKFSKTFERTGVFSNWPATGIESFNFDSTKRTFYLEGELGVQDGMTEIYAESYQFNKDYTEFKRRNVANFSDMPITEFNLTMTCTGRKTK